jgi:hypothetical protein
VVLVAREARAGPAVRVASVAQGVLASQAARVGLMVREARVGRVVPVAQEVRPDPRRGQPAVARASAAHNVRAHSAI